MASHLSLSYIHWYFIFIDILYSLLCEWKDLKILIWSFLILYLSHSIQFSCEHWLFWLSPSYFFSICLDRKVYEQLSAHNLSDNERWMLSSDLDYKNLFRNWTFVYLELNLRFNCCWIFDKFGVQLPTTKLGFLR